MRRLLLVSVVVGVLVVSGCSSSKKDDNSSASSSTTVAAANEAACSDLKTFVDDLNAKQKDIGDGSGAAGATRIQAFFAAMLPSLEAAQATAPATVKPSLTTLQTAWTDAATLDPNDPTAQQKLGTILFLGQADVRAAMSSVLAYAKSACNIETAA